MHRILSCHVCCCFLLPRQLYAFPDYECKLTTHHHAVQRAFASLYKEGAAAGSGEDAELLFAHMSAAAHTTRNMGEAGKK